MSLPPSSEHAAVPVTRAAHVPRWPRASALALCALLLSALAACSHTRTRNQAPASAPAAPAAPAGAAAPAPAAAAKPGAPAGAAGATPGGAPGAAPTETVPAAPVHPEVPAAARADFNRAVKFMQAGNAVEAELGFKQVELQYPQFAAPLVDLAILERKAGHLDQAETTLKSAVSRESGSALAWTELGVTQRMRGEFKDAAFSYQQAIAADPRYAPAWRNLGVVSDLYLADPNRALAAFEQYKQITGEDKPVSGWIAELRQRLGMPPVKRPEAPQGAGGTATETPPGTPGQEPVAAPQGTAPAVPAPVPQSGASPTSTAAGAVAPRTGG